MAIGDDFTVDYTDKKVTHTSGTTVYTVNALYSWLMDTFDELVQMDDQVPMSAQTPSAYTFVNGWYIDDDSMKYLKEGAIETDGWNSVVLILDLASGGYVNCIAGDIGKVVTDDAADVGELLAYDNTLRKWWIRDTNSHGAIATGSTMAITTGTGAGTADGGSATGENLYANIYTLGTIESLPAPQIYIFQDGSALAEWSDLTNWDRGHLDVLIKVKEAGTEIDGAVITVFARQSGDLFDNFEIDLSAGGRNAVPLSTSSDLNDTSGSHYLLFDTETSSFANVGDILTGGTSEATAEIVAVTDWGTTGVLTLRGIKGTFQNNETITDGHSGSATSNGTVGDTYIAYDTETVAFTTMDQTITGGTSGAKRLLKGVQDDGTTGKLVMLVDTSQTGANKDKQYLAFSTGETITGSTEGSADADGASTTVAAGYSDVTITFVNGTATTSGTTGTFVENERVTFAGGSGILLKDASSVVTLGNMTITAINGLTITGDHSGATCVASQNLQSAHTMNKAFEQGSDNPYDVIVDCAGRQLSEVYEYFKYVTQEDSTFAMYTVEFSTITILDGEEYIIAHTAYAPKKASPLGTFAGGKLFGPRGLWVIDMHTDDSQNYQLIDSDGDTNNPPNYQSIAVTALVSGDRVAVFRTSAGAVNKAMYTMTTQGAGIGTITVGSAISSDTPSAGYIRVVDDSADTEQRYEYTSWTGSVFTLSGVTSVAYTTSDTAYVPYIDEQASGASVSKSVIYVSDRTVMIRVRIKGIIPFETTGTYGSTGLSVAAIRTTDSIVT
jgi:hypothetical protein